VTDDELQQRLQARDPASSLPPADPTWVARLLEDTMGADLETHTDNQTETRASGTRNRSKLTWLVAAAAVLIAGVGVFGLLTHDPDPAQVPSAGDSPSVTGPATVTELGASPATNAKCMVPNADLLSRSQVAFSGTVQEVADDVVVLAPDRFYTGEPTDLVEVRSDPAMLQALIGAVDFQVDQRYLVSATDGRVTVCGFSGPYSTDLAALYTAAFPG
jgi:hypothetical protein